MFEAKLQEGALLKKVVESIKDLVTEVNFDTTATGRRDLRIRYIDAGDGRVSCGLSVAQHGDRLVLELQK